MNWFCTAVGTLDMFMVIYLKNTTEEAEEEEVEKGVSTIDFLSVSLQVFHFQDVDTTLWKKWIHRIGLLNLHLWLGKKEDERRAGWERTCLFSGFVTSFCLPQRHTTRELINVIRLNLFHASPKPACGVQVCFCTCVYFWHPCLYCLFEAKWYTGTLCAAVWG